MPRAPLGDRPMTNAERQARHRVARAAAQPVIQYRRAADRRSRARRWCDAVAVLVALQAEYAAWLDALPETLRDGATGEALQAIVELDLDELTAVVPPRGYGRDQTQSITLDRHLPSTKNTHASEAPNPGDIIS